MEESVFSSSGTGIFSILRRILKRGGCRYFIEDEICDLEKCRTTGTIKGSNT